jgi:Glycosyl hydrolases family 2, sugar binding domain/Glycosyl hydrolases family 2, TIM barrel domain
MQDGRGGPVPADPTASNRRDVIQLLAAGVALSIIAPLSSEAAGPDDEPLDAAWRFARDEQDRGLSGKWFQGRLPQRAILPASLPQQEIGAPIGVDTPWTGSILSRAWFTSPDYAVYRQPGNIKVPFWLQPETYYKAPAWYQRHVTVPASWKGKRVVLILERPHWQTMVWLDGKLAGENSSLSTPHEYEFGMLAPGNYQLTIRVDNRVVIDIGTDSSGITDHTQGNWNGIAGKIALRATDPVWIEDLQVYPQSQSQALHVKGRIGNITGAGGRDTLRLSVEGYRTSLAVVWDAQGGEFETEMPLQDAASAPLAAWDEFSPNVHTLSARLGERDRRDVTFGCRELKSQGAQFYLNGRKLFFRGTLECCVFPQTGHPPTDVESWKRIIRVAKSYGLNLLRFHSYCPPEAAFQAADELGIYCQVETCWANGSATLGDGKPVDQWAYDETDRILKAYGNHPSFMLMPYGNEPGGEKHKDYLRDFVRHFKARDSRRLWTSGSGWPEISENDFHVTPEPRIQHWDDGVGSRINALAPETVTDYREFIRQRQVPVISHEVGQWCVYPNFAEIPKYKGYLKAKNFEIFRDRLAASGLGHLAVEFLLASGKLQTLCYKEDIESALRTPGMGGFELLDIHDFPGQGTALVGVLDPFWGDKGYVTGEEYSRFCNALVPLARLRKRIFHNDQSFDAVLDVANFGSAGIENARLSYFIRGKDGAVHAAGQSPALALPIGNEPMSLPVSLDLSRIAKAQACKFVVRINSADGKVLAENDWDVWIYPRPSGTDSRNGIKVASSLDDKILDTVKAGGKLLLTFPGVHLRNFDDQPVKLGFSSIFWNTAWTDRQAPTTLGLLCDPKHPALADFPTDFHSNWQWWYLVHRAGALRLDLLPKEMEPIVRVIDDWTTARPLGLILEAKLGAGALIICGFDLTDAADPVSRQLHDSLTSYMNGPHFAPKVEVTENQVRALLA